VHFLAPGLQVVEDALPRGDGFAHHEARQLEKEAQKVAVEAVEVFAVVRVHLQDLLSKKCGSGSGEHPVPDPVVKTDVLQLSDVLRILD